MERVDDRFDYGEVRVYPIGLVNGMEITVIYTDRGDDERRIISAWKAEAHERRTYWEKIEGR
ncbi:MAG: BrnT family toxin [Syntrophobacteraceae bacterium]